MSIKNITIGSDPEMFILTESKVLTTPQYRIYGSKDNPFPLNNDGFFVQRDNMAAEFCIPPAKNVKEFTRNIALGIFLVSEMLPEGYSLAPIPSAIFDPFLIDNDGEALVFGCDPDYDAYTLAKNAKPCSTNKYLRSTGGHIHIGYDDPNTATSVNIIKLLDLFLGVPSVILDNDIERRQLYGNAGAFREKSYGVEYRTLSSFWLKDAQHVEWVFNTTLEALGRYNEFIVNGVLVDKQTESLIVDCINTNNKSIAEELMGVYRLNLPSSKILTPKKDLYYYDTSNIKKETTV